MRKFFLLLPLLLVVFVASLKWGAPSLLREFVVTQVRQGCPACTIDIASLSLEVLKGELLGSKVDVQGDPNDSTRFEFSAGSVQIDFDWMALLRGSLRIARLSVDNVDVRLDDRAPRPGDQDGPPDYSWMRDIPEMQVGTLEVRNGRFSYARAEKGGVGKVNFKGIGVETGPFGTREPLAPKNVRVQARGLVANSGNGSFELDARVGLFEEEKIDSIVIDVRKVDLGALDRYLIPVEGLRLDGKLERGHAELELRKRELTGTMQLGYKGLKFHFGESKRSNGSDRSRDEVPAALKEVVASLAVANTQPKVPNGPLPIAKIRATQKSEDGVIEFLLFELKEGVFRILKG